MSGRDADTNDGPIDPLAHRRLVWSIVRRYTGAGPRGILDEDDLFQEGFRGLMRACAKFDPARKIRFSTYATYWIRQEIGRAIVERAYPIRIPDYLCDAMAKPADTLPDGKKDLVRQAHLLRSRPVLSLDRDRGERGMFEPAVGPEDGSDEGPDPAPVVDGRLPRVLEALDSLPERYRVVLRLSTGLDPRGPLELAEIGELLNVTTKTVWNYHKVGREAIRGILGTKRAYRSRKGHGEPTRRSAAS